jgi:hypothetical protein
MIFTSQTRALVADAEPFWIPKLVVRLFTLAAATAAVATFLSGLPHTFDIFQLIFPLVVSVKWNVAVIAVRLSRARPMHPAIVLFFDMTIWGVLVAFTALAVLQGATLAEAAQQGNTGTGDPSLNALLAKSPDAATASPIILATSGFAGGAFVGHFILFVWAAVDWHTRRKKEITSMAPGARLKQFPGWDWANSPTEQAMRSRVGLVREMSTATTPHGAWWVPARSDMGSRAGHARTGGVAGGAAMEEQRFAHTPQNSGWPMHDGIDPSMTMTRALSPVQHPDTAFVRRDDRSGKEALEEVEVGLVQPQRSESPRSRGRNATPAPFWAHSPRGDVVLGSTRSRRTASSVE